MMHEGEIATDTEQVRRLVARQFPQWADLPVTAVPLGGTDHALYRPVGSPVWRRTCPSPSPRPSPWVRPARATRGRGRWSRGCPG